MSATGETRSHRRIVVLVSTAIYLALAALQIIGAFEEPERVASIGVTENFRAYDFLNFSTAFRLFEQRANPYDQDAQNKYLQAYVGTQYPHRLDLLYPPWLLVLLAPVLWFSFEAAHWIWFVCCFGMLLYCGCRGIRLIADSAPLPRGIAAAFFCMPVYVVLYWGQLSIFVATLLLVFFWAVRDRRDGLGGFCLAAASIKPHLWFVFAPVLGLWMLSNRRYALLFSSIGWLAVLAAIAEVVSPGIHVNWITNMAFVRAHSGNSVGSNLPSIVRLLVFRSTGELVDWPQVVIPATAVLAFAAGALVRFSRVFSMRYALFAIIASVCCSPYGWFHDQAVLLLVQVFLVAAAHTQNCRRREQIELLLELFFLQAATLVLAALRFDEQYQFFWYPLVMAAILFRHAALFDGMSFTGERGPSAATARQTAE